MKAKLVLLVLLGLLAATVVVSGFSDNVFLGPFSVRFIINTTDQPVINISEPMKYDDYTKYEFKLETGSQKRELIDVLVYDYENSTNISENRLMDLITNRVASQSYKATWDRVAIGNTTALRAKIHSSGKSSYIAAYSPDGKVIVFVESFAPLAVTNSFLQGLRVSASDP